MYVSYPLTKVITANTVEEFSVKIPLSANFASITYDCDVTPQSVICSLMNAPLLLNLGQRQIINSTSIREHNGLTLMGETYLRLYLQSNATSTTTFSISINFK